MDRWKMGGLVLAMCGIVLWTFGMAYNPTTQLQAELRSAEMAAVTFVKQKDGLLADSTTVDFHGSKFLDTVRRVKVSSLQPTKKAAPTAGMRIRFKLPDKELVAEPCGNRQWFIQDRGLVELDSFFSIWVQLEWSNRVLDASAKKLDLMNERTEATLEQMRPITGSVADVKPKLPAIGYPAPDASKLGPDANPLAAYVHPRLIENRVAVCVRNNTNQLHLIQEVKLSVNDDFGHHCSLDEPSLTGETRLPPGETYWISVPLRAPNYPDAEQLKVVGEIWLRCRSLENPYVRTTFKDVIELRDPPPTPNAAD